MIFYVSTQGHSASKWIADTFNLHPDVICFHGSRTIPPVSPGDRLNYLGHELSDIKGDRADVAKLFAKSAHQCACHSGKIFGGVHGIWGLHAKKPIEALGGQFAGIIRHPIDQFHSMMTAFTPRAISKKLNPLDYRTQYSYCDIIELNETLFTKLLYLRDVASNQDSVSKATQRLFYKTMRKLDDIKIEFTNYKSQHLDEVLKGRNQSRLVDNVSIITRQNLQRVFDDAFEFHNRLEESHVIKMEAITSDFYYYQNVFKTILGTDYPNDLRSKVFKTSHGHYHSVVKRAPEQHWEMWPAALKGYFLEQLDKYTGLRKFYSSQSYWMP